MNGAHRDRRGQHLRERSAVRRAHPSRAQPPGSLSLARWDTPRRRRARRRSSARSTPAARRCATSPPPTGAPGYFQHRFAVYGREGKPCRALRHADPRRCARASARPSTARGASDERHRHLDRSRARARGEPRRAQALAPRDGAMRSPRSAAGRWSARLIDEQTATRLAHLERRLVAETLTIAFVAEYSRGKSELINALFFAGTGTRAAALGRRDAPRSARWRSSGIRAHRRRSGCCRSRSRESPRALREYLADRWRHGTRCALDPGEAGVVAHRVRGHLRDGGRHAPTPRRTWASRSRRHGPWRSRAGATRS